jgi:hypothetical protein
LKELGHNSFCDWSNDMKILVYSKDDAVKEFCQNSAGRYGIYLNFLALKDFITNMDDNLDPGDLVTLIFDYDIESEREMIDDFNSEISLLDNVFTAYISGETSLKELREHQKSDSSANAYLFKPLSTDAVEQAIEDFEAASTKIIENPLLSEEAFDATASNILEIPGMEVSDGDEEDAATVVDLNFKNLGSAISEYEDGDDDDLDLGLTENDSTGVREVVRSHNEEINLVDSEANDKIQDLFDKAFDDEDEILTDSKQEVSEGFDLPSDLGELSLSDSSEILEGIEPLNDGSEIKEDLESSNAEFSLDDSVPGLSLSDGSEDILNIADESEEDSSEDLDDGSFSLDLGGEIEDNEEVEDIAFDTGEINVVENKIEDVIESDADDGISYEVTAEFQMGQFDLPVEKDEVKEVTSNNDFLDMSEDTDILEDTEGLNFSIPEVKEPEEKITESVAERKVEHKVEAPPENYTIPRMNESEALRYQATIAQLREEREGLLETINKQKQELAVNHQDGLGNKAELEEAKIEISIMKKRYLSEVEDMKYQLKMATDKKEYTEEKNKFMEKEFSRLEQRVRVDVNQIQQREKELEGQLELVKIDSESQVQTRDKKILDLKRKIDQLEFNMENAAIREQKSRDDKVHLEDRLDKIMRTLRGSIEVLEDDMSWTDKEK